MLLTWQALNKLEAEYGEAFFILDLNKFKDNYRNFLTSFREIYPNTNLGYSYKTNYIPKLCQCVNAMGGYAEVVSQMEYDLAIRIGVEPSKIIFNGPLKSKEEIEKAILAGSIVNLDSLQEVTVVESLARKLPEHKISFGLRCNFDIGTDRISRFGLDVENGDLDKVFSIFRDLSNCSIAGLHCHFSTPARSVESYALRTKRILEVSDEYFQAGSPQFIDIGGGFFGKMPEELSQQFDYPIPSYQEYAEVIASQFQRKYIQRTAPQLILEPGVAIVADVMRFVGKVVGVKTIRSRNIALLVGSIHNIAPTLNSKRLPLTVYRNPDSTESTIAAPVDLVGYTCMEHDCLLKDYLGEVGIGDYAVFNNIGAYTIVFKPPFIRPNPPILAYDSASDEYTLARRKETTDDVFSTYLI